MNKLNKVAILFATAALATAAGAQTIDNWRNGTSELVWKNGTNELCWRDANWTPATAAQGCDGAIVAKPPAPAPHLPLLRQLLHQPLHLLQPQPNHLHPLLHPLWPKKSLMPQMPSLTLTKPC